MRFRRVLVTGANGFLASALLPLLKKRLPRAKVVAASRKTSDLADCGAARRLIARARPDLVMHLAGARPPADLDALWRDNVTATIRLCAALRGTGARLVVAGSSGEYGPAPKRPVSEDFPANPLTLYGRVKHAQTLAALSFVHEGLDVRVARLFNVLGPGTPESLAPGAFAAQAARLERAGGGTLKVGDLRPTRDYIDVRDAAAGLLAVALAPALSGCTNVCSGRGVAMSQVLEGILDAARAPLKAVRDPARLRAVEVRGITGSHARLTRAAGWRPRVALERSLKDTLAWHRSA
ncbi:MAG: NAD(P)-dependent oxidoreductase [Elusimicrobia bacterium]|nr:NAD(P)-dependent oxidoreductase [Elusimicrobiota bacterium]